MNINPTNSPIITVDQTAKLIAEKYPVIWKRINTKFINNPGTHAGVKPLNVALASACIEFHSYMQGKPNKSTVSTNIGAVTAILERYDFPVYYVSKPLLNSIMHTRPPIQFKWSDVFFPFDALSFMIPLDAIQEQPSNGKIFTIGVCKLKGNSSVIIPGTNTKISMNGIEDRICVFWCVQEGLILQDVTFPVSQPLEPSPGWIEEKTTEYIDVNGMNTSNGPNAAFSSYIAGIVANLLLTMQARKELIESGSKSNKILKSGSLIYSPTFIGRKYQVIHKKIDDYSPGARFTELGWRSGYLRVQHFGKNNQEKKIILIDPYIAFSKGLSKI
jgi:hypothetical protein